jgi:hypothetical protein
VEDALVSARGELVAMAPTARRGGLLIEEASPALDELEALPDRDELRGLSAADLAARVADESAELTRLEQELASRRQKASGLETLLAEVPAEQRPKIARLPDPRPPPAGATEMAFFVRYGRVQAIDVEKLKKLLSLGISQALGDDRGVLEDDKPFLENYFAKIFVGDDSFRWTFRQEGRRSFFADIGWRTPEQGEGLFELRAGAPALRARLRDGSPSRQFVRFYVWADSFETYLEARYIAESLGYDVGWMAVDAADEVGIDLLGGPRRPVLID